jgi:hypothetical protein
MWLIIGECGGEYSMAKRESHRRRRRRLGGSMVGGYQSAKWLIWRGGNEKYHLSVASIKPVSELAYQ